MKAMLIGCIIGAWLGIPVSVALGLSVYFAGGFAWGAITIGIVGLAALSTEGGE